MPIEAGTCILHGGEIDSLDRFYEELANMLSLPDHFGRNLDALWDVLIYDVTGPVELVWEDTVLSRNAMGKDFDSIISVLREVAAEREDFHLLLR